MTTKVGLTREEATSVDRRCTDEFAIPSLLLMENAGIRAFDEIQRLLAERPEGRREVDLLCGGGNNGGDGFVIARHLVNHGMDPRIVLVNATESRILARNGDAATNLVIARKMGIPWREARAEELLEEPGSGTRAGALLVDGIFGTGLARPVEGALADWMKSLAGRRDDLVALDLPSGLDCDTGKVLGAALPASTTITFVGPKRGFFLEDGPDYVGRIVVGDISAPRSLLPAR